jgi:tetratricopeptide (TPR) repeat protein
MERLSQYGLVLASLRYRFDGLPEEAWIAVEPMRIADTQRLIDTFAGLHALTEHAKRELSERCEGHPRTVVFVEQLISQKRKRSLSRSTDGSLDELLGQTHDKIREDLMLQELWRCLSEEAQQHARILSVLRRPVPGAVIESLGVAAVELRDSSLLIPTRHLGEKHGQPEWRERWDMLGVVASFVAAQPPLPDWIAIHKAVGVALKTHVKGNGDDRLWSDQEEAIHHLHAAKEGTLAWPFVEEYVIHLRGRAHYREAHAVLSKCDAAGTSGDQLAQALGLMIQMEGRLGQTTFAAVAQLDRAFDLALSEQTKSWLLHEYGLFNERQGKYAEAETLLRLSLTLKEKSLGVEHPSFGASLHALASVLSSQGNYAEAEILLRRTLALLENSLGMEHPEYGVVLHGLAGVLSKQGKYVEAETLLRRSLILYEKSLGMEHPEYGASLHELAGVLSSQGKYVEAETLLRRSLAIDEQTLGVDHPDYGASLCTLANVLSREGKYVEAETLLRRSVVLYEKALGVEHPDYGASLHALANVLSKQGKDAEAETLLRLSLALKEKALGVEHPSFGASLHVLAGVLSSQGNYAEAETLLRRTLALYEKTLGVEHPSLCPTLSNLAAVLAQQSKAAEGLPLLHRAHAIATNVHGMVHPDVGHILSLLAQIQAILKLSIAPQTAKQAMVILIQCLGPEHPTTQKVRCFYERLTRATFPQPT